MDVFTCTSPDCYALDGNDGSDGGGAGDNLWSINLDNRDNDNRIFTSPAASDVDGDGLLDFEKTMEDLAGLDNEAIQRLIPNIRGQLAIKAIKADMEGFRANTEAFKDTAGSTDKAVQAMNNSFGQQSRMLKENLRNGLIEVGLAISESLVSEDGTGPLNKVNETLSAIGRIGWDEIGSRIYTNFQAIFSAVLQTIAILWGQVGQYALENFGQALQWVGDLEHSGK